MRQRRNLGLAAYIFFDLLAAGISWTVLFLFRKIQIENYNVDSALAELGGQKFLLGVIFISLGWLLIYFLVGCYGGIYRKSRLTEFNKTLLLSIIGNTFLFFFLLLDDQVMDYKNYYQTYLVLLGSHLFLTQIFRMILLTRAHNRLRSGKVFYKTIIIGGNLRALELFKEMNQNWAAQGNKFIGFLNTNGQPHPDLLEALPQIGNVEDVVEVLAERAIDEIIIAVDPDEHPQIQTLISELINNRVILKIIPDNYDILSGSVKMTNVLSAPLIEIYPDLMPTWQKNIKRLLDVFAALLCIVLLLPLYLFCAVRVKLSSKGPVFYKQERVGINGRGFNLIKFRSMQVNAEADGPALSSKFDPRITKWGRVMRKWRLDETPQFFNVLIGEMSLVGPRPEREYYRTQIIERAPEFRHLVKVKPGLTSWGMVKFGYAESVDEMIVRMKYDLLYIENMSLALDFKIMIYTALIILQGKGK